MRQECPQVGDSVVHAAPLQEKKRQSIVGARSVRFHLEHASVRPHRLIGHADVRVGDGDLLEYVRVTGVLAQSEAEGCQRFVVLLLPEEVGAFRVVVGFARTVFGVAGNQLSPPGHRAFTTEQEKCGARSPTRRRRAGRRASLTGAMRHGSYPARGSYATATSSCSRSSSAPCRRSWSTVPGGA